MRNSFTSFCLFIFFFFSSSSLLGQSSLSPATSDKYPKFISAAFNYGWVWKHHKDIVGLPDAYPKGLEINIGWQTTGKKTWQQLHNFPRWGFQLLYYYLDDPTQLGQSFQITPYMDLFLLKRPKHELYIKIGTGLAFYSKQYNAETNPYNTLISSPINSSGLFSMTYRYLISDHWSVIGGFNFNHGSNGSFKQPNLGINIPSLQVGTHYTFHPERIKFIKQPLPDFKKSLNWYTNVSFSSKQSSSEPLNDVNYLAVTLSTYAGKRLTRKSMVLAGLDACYDESLKYELRDNPDYQQNKYSIYRFAATVGYAFILTEKTHILMQNGIYLYDPYNLDVPVYQRYGFRFNPIKNLYFGYYLKTHLAKADFWEFAVGVKI
jgi:hypothetical protein